MMLKSELTVFEACTFFQRLRGLLGRAELSETEALLMASCSTVHSFGMNYSLDIVFLNKSGDVLKVSVLKPNSWVGCRGAEYVLELKTGCAQRHGFIVGESLNTLTTQTIEDRDEF